MKDTHKVIAAGATAALMAAGAVQGVALADAAPLLPAQNAGVAVEQAQQVSSGRVRCNEVAGTFAFTQGAVSSNDWIARHIGEGSKYLCGSEVVRVADAPNAADWVIEISGDVDSPLSATIGTLAATSEVQSVLMGCSCAGNPGDGLAVANAIVEGIPVAVLLQMVGPSESANTIVFVSADGYEVALPLSYVGSRYCPLVFNVNGSSLIESVGGTNQLWLGSTPANYFVRDVVSIRLETRDAAPASPVSDAARSELANLPNIGVAFGGEVA